MLTEGGASDKAGELSGPRRAEPGAGDAHGVSGATGKHRQPGLYRGPEGVRRETQTALAKQVALGASTSVIPGGHLRRLEYHPRAWRCLARGPTICGAESQFRRSPDQAWPAMARIR